MLNKNNSYFKKIAIFICLIFIPFIVSASSSVGYIDDEYKYAKGVEHSEVKINFALFNDSINAVMVTDDFLSGYAWGSIIGTINLHPGGGGVLNNGEGVLSGYASSDNGGWINFNGVKINSSGDFEGYATTEKLGKIIFNCSTNNSCSKDNFKVTTDWRPVSVRKNTTPDPTYVNPVNTPPPVFTSNSNPSQNTSTNTKNSSSNSSLPTDTSLYQNNGDVVKDNSTTVKGGQVTTIRLPGGTDVVNQNNVAPSANVNVSTNNEKSNTNIVTDTAKNVTKIVQNTSTQVEKVANVVTQTPAIDISTKTVTTIGVAGGGTAIFSSLTGGLFSFSEFFITFLRMWSLFLSALGLRKRKQPWGTVYDSVTKQPLDPAYVVLQDKNGKEVATSITDLDGRYGFFVPPGTYRMIAKKTNYIMPSLHLHAKEKDELYENLYFGEEIELGDNRIITRNIPMDPQGFDWNEFAKRDKNIMRFHTPHKKVMAQVSNAFFIIGLLFSVGLFIFKPDIFNICILLLYVFLSTIRFVKLRPKSFGVIKDKINGQPLSFAVVRVYLKSNGKEMFHRVADEYGHYYCLLAKGEYYVTIEKKNNDESYTPVFTSDVINAKSGIINQDFLV